MLIPELLDPNDPIDAASIRERKEFEEYIATGKLPNEQTRQHREEWLANKKPEQPKKEQPIEEKKPLTERIYNFKTVAIVAVIAFVLGWSAFWLFGNRSGRFQTVKWGNAAFILDTRTGEVYYLNGEKVTRKF